MSAALDALAASIVHLRDLVGRLVPDDLEEPAFPSEWTVADTLSHIGSAMVITVKRVDASLAGGQLSSDEIQAVWDEWNAKEPQQQAADALMADDEALERLAGLSQDERMRLQVQVGPLSLGYEAFVNVRVAEHALHVWDIESAFDPQATVQQQSVDLIVDLLGPVVGWSGRADGAVRAMSVRTIDPERGFLITTNEERVSLTATPPAADAGIVLPAEAFVRLVYGRLPENLTPRGVIGADRIADLRSVFRGV